MTSGRGSESSGPIPLVPRYFAGALLCKEQGLARVLTEVDDDVRALTRSEFEAVSGLDRFREEPAVVPDLDERRPCSPVSPDSSSYSSNLRL